MSECLGLLVWDEGKVLQQKMICVSVLIEFQTKAQVSGKNWRYLTALFVKI